MSAQPSPWDTAADLATDEDLSAHLDVCFEEGGSDARFASRSPAKIAGAEGIEAVAKREALAGERLDVQLCQHVNPGFGQILQVIYALGLRLHADDAA